MQSNITFHFKKTFDNRLSHTQDIFRFFSFLVLAIFVFSCTSIPPKNTEPFGTTAHFPENCILVKNYKPSANTEYFCYESKAFPLIYHVVTVNLSSSVKISQFPQLKSYGTTKSQPTKQFAKQNNATIAINTTPFSLQNPNIIGIGIENYSEFSPASQKYSALIFDSDGPKIISQKDIAQYSDVSLAVGGFFTILKDGLHYGEYLQNRDSRTAIGISKDKKTLTILVVEGEQKSKSVGLSYFECAEIFLKFSVYDALQFDGGRSSSLIINQCNVMNYNNYQKNALNLAIIDEEK